MTIRIVFFGTGSGRPMPQRNVSGLAMVREGETLLFDCGECTQLRLMESSVRPGNISSLFLTHFHGDHVNGLPGLLGSLGLNKRETPLSVYAPTGLKRWFDVMHNLHILRVDRFATLNEITNAGIVHSTEEYDVWAQPLEHRVKCFGYALVEHPRPGRFNLQAAQELGLPPGPMYGQLQRGESVEWNGKTIHPSMLLGEARPGLKIVYCTDTRPCNATIAFAKDADLLIHEATYPGGFEQEAYARGHSTATDAAIIAKKAGVKRLVLTHFSQKYFTTAPFLESARKIFPHVEAATDLAEFVVEREN